MSDSIRKVTSWQLRGRTLELGRRTLVMGIVNITPDSFSDGGRFLDPQAAVEHGLRLLDEGADILDLGAESTRPGSSAVSAFRTSVSADEEQARLLPALEGILRVRPDAIVSVDTYKAETARAALKTGAEIVNDVSGFKWDVEKTTAGPSTPLPHPSDDDLSPGTPVRSAQDDNILEKPFYRAETMAAVCAEAGCGVVLMHTRSRPEEWAAQPQLGPDELLDTVRAGLRASMEKAVAAGIPLERIVLDPGYGFGKRFEENYTLLARQAELLALGRPLLAGVSRKSFLGRTLAPLHGGNDAPVEARETAGVAAMTAAILHGASIVRVHEVRQAVEAARIADAVLAGG
jgi:dihydropteroate synthase